MKRIGLHTLPFGEVLEWTFMHIATAAPADFVPLHLEPKTHVTTAVMCHHLTRKPQTARGWASAETFPEGLRPLRINGRLAWPVAGIRRVLGVAQ